MSLLEQIKKDQFEARKNKESLKAVLLTTLFAEASMIGKNAGNRDTTDDETAKVIQKFLKGVNETIEFVTKGNNTEALATAQAEKAILEAYLPKMATADEIEKAVGDLVAEGINTMGAIMKALKEKFGSTLDGKLASKVVGAALA